MTSKRDKLERFFLAFSAASTKRMFTTDGTREQAKIELPKTWKIYEQQNISRKQWESVVWYYRAIKSVS